MLVALALSLAGTAWGQVTQCGDAGPWCNTSLSADQRAQLLLSRLDQAQKIALLAGNDPLGVLGVGGHTGSNAGVPGLVPSVNFTDGTAGIRVGQTTALPAEIAVAATWDPALARLDGSVLGNEARLRGNDVIYAPTLTIMRTPLAGRTFQALGEDPYLASELGVGLIDGIQAQGVIANANIYVANNQEGEDPTGVLGLPGEPLGLGLIGDRLLVDAVVSQRALREIYLPPFEAAVEQAHVGSVMCAYNLVNGIHNCENGPLLNGILKQQWGFKGFVLSDYGAALNTVRSFSGGLDFDPWPGVAYSSPLVTAALATGAATDAELNDHVFRYLRTLFAFGVFDRPPYTNQPDAIDKAAHAAAAQKIAESGITLLQNRGSLLPLDAAQLRSIAVIGPEANAFLTGGGSSSVTPYANVSPYQGIAQRAGPGVTVTYDSGTDQNAAVALAKRSTVAVVVGASYETEGADIQCLDLECPDAYGDQDQLIRAIAAANPNTIVVLENGGPVLTPWRTQVKALVDAWYPGEQGGAAIARVLFGDIDPSGHLPVTFPQAYSQESMAGDPSAYPGVLDTVTYKEGVFVGYRWFDAHDETPAFPFGFGLSYTNFAFSGLTVKPGGVVSFTVRNTGSRAGADVAQLYLGLPSLPGVPQPPEQLKGFDRVSLAPGQRVDVRFHVDARDLSYWDTATSRWQVTPGCVSVMVGDSSANLPLRGSLAQGGRCR